MQQPEKMSMLQRLSAWWFPRANMKEEYEKSMKELLGEKDALERKLKEMADERNFFRIHAQTARIVLEKRELLSGRELLDMQKLSKLPEYQSLRAYFLKTALEIHHRSSLVSDKAESWSLAHVARLIEDFTLDMDKLREEEASTDNSPDAYEG